MHALHERPLFPLNKVTKVPTSPIIVKFELWKENPFHPSLRFKCVNSEDNIWSVRVNLDYRALAVRERDLVVWYWIGDHNRYKQLLKSL